MSSGQDGGVVRNASLPHTTKRRTTTYLKTINNQKCQKIKLHGTPTMKELKKHSPRPVGRSQGAGQAEKTSNKAMDCVGRAGCAGCAGRQGLAEWETETQS